MSDSMWEATHLRASLTTYDEDGWRVCTAWMSEWCIAPRTCLLIRLSRSALASGVGFLRPRSILSSWSALTTIRNE